MIPRDTPRILEMSYREIFIEFFFGLSLAICALLVLVVARGRGREGPHRQTQTRGRQPGMPQMWAPVRVLVALHYLQRFDRQRVIDKPSAR